MKKKLKIIIYLALVSLSQSIMAEEVKLYSKPPSAEKLSQELFPDDNSPESSDSKSSAPKMRSMSFGLSNDSFGNSSSKKQSPNKSKSKRINYPASTPRKGIGLPIQFEYNSAAISNESDAFLDQVGKMLKMEKLANAKLLIEGNTDAYGSAEYNKILSRERAMSVKNYLIDRYNIMPNRLIVAGNGKNRPLKNTDPFDPLNRRVEFYKGD
jgi:OmpA-OmpF porin, OOP family